MKNTLIFSLFTISVCLIFFACSKTNDCNTVNLNTAFDFKQSESFCVEPNIEFQIVEIIDERCPCDVACIWEGEFIFKLSINDNGKISEYFIHEKLDNHGHPESGLDFTTIIRKFDDSCEAAVDVADMIFSMKIST